MPITVKSAVVLPVKIIGRTFWLSKASTQLFLQINDTAEKIPIDVGFRFRLLDPDMFTSLTFSAAVDATAEFYYGTALLDYIIHP